MNLNKVFILGNLAGNYLNGKLDRQTLLKDITFLVLAALLIFTTSRWGI